MTRSKKLKKITVISLLFSASYAFSMENSLESQFKRPLSYFKAFADSGRYFIDKETGLFGFVRIGEPVDLYEINNQDFEILENIPKPLLERALSDLGAYLSSYPAEYFNERAGFKSHSFEELPKRGPKPGGWDDVNGIFDKRNLDPKTFSTAFSDQIQGSHLGKIAVDGLFSYAGSMAGDFVYNMSMDLFRKPFTYAFHRGGYYPIYLEKQKKVRLIYNAELNFDVPKEEHNGHIISGEEVVTERTKMEKFQDSVAKHTVSLGVELMGAFVDYSIHAFSNAYWRSSIRSWDPQTGKAEYFSPWKYSITSTAGGLASYFYQLGKGMIKSSIKAQIMGKYRQWYPEFRINQPEEGYNFLGVWLDQGEYRYAYLEIDADVEADEAPADITADVK